MHIADHVLHTLYSSYMQGFWNRYFLRCCQMNRIFSWEYLSHICMQWRTFLWLYLGVLYTNIFFAYNVSRSSVSLKFRCWHQVVLWRSHKHFTHSGSTLLLLCLMITNKTFYGHRYHLLPYYMQKQLYGIMHILRKIIEYINLLMYINQMYIYINIKICNKS